jgi:hypothetical protein
MEVLIGAEYLETRFIYDILGFRALYRIYRHKLSWIAKENAFTMFVENNS